MADETSGAVGGLRPQTTYTFTVTAVDAAANESAPSAPVDATTAAGAPVGGLPWDVYAELAAALAPRVAAYVGRAGDSAAVASATEYVPTVATYVHGYTRGRGWVAATPAGPLCAVIVAASARLLTNPEQLTTYALGDYSERPAVLNGWTLAERDVLNRYRRTVA